MKTINFGTNVIECDNRRYRIVDIEGVVPWNNDCIITGWHIKNGKIITKGKILFVPGTGNFIIRDNFIENE